MLELAEADLELGFFHVKAPQACRKSFAELVDANTELTIEGDLGFKSRYSATCNAVPMQVREESAELRRYYRQM
jgi:hypothetical protein